MSYELKSISGLQLYFTQNSAEVLTKQQISDLKKELESKPTEHPLFLEKEIDALFKRKDPLSALHLLSELFSLQELQEAIEKKGHAQVRAFHEAKEMLAEAQFFFNTLENHAEVSIRTKILAFYDSAISILESFLSAFGIADFFKPSKNQWEAQGKFGKIMMLLGLGSTLTTLFGPTGTIVALGLLFFIVSLSLIFPYIKPMPSHLPVAENWSKLFREGHLKAYDARKECVQAIATTFCEKRLPMLIGASGVGKTETVKTFAAAIEKGDFPELQGKQVFYLNTLDLIKEGDAALRGGGENILIKIRNEIGQYREKIILVFDEIHEACKGKKGAIGEQLKTRLGQESDFPYVIGLTTEDEYVNHICKNKAFARRFRKITITNTKEDEVVRILSHTFLHEAPKLICGQDALRTLSQKVAKAFKERVEPACSLEILHRCIQKMENPEKSDVEKTLESKIKERDAIIAQRALSFGSGAIESKQRQKMTTLQNEISALEQQVKDHTQKVQEFFLKRDLLFEAKKLLCKMVISISSKANESQDQNEDALKMFLLLQHFFAPQLTEKLTEQAETLGLHSELNSRLIDSAISEELKSRKK